MKNKFKIGLVVTAFLALMSLSLFSNSFVNNHSYSLGSEFSSSTAQLSYTSSGDMNQKNTEADVYNGFSTNSNVNFAASTYCSNTCTNTCTNRCSNTCSTNSRCYPSH